MAVVQISSSLCTSIYDGVMSYPVSLSSSRGSTCTQFRSAFTTGSPLFFVWWCGLGRVIWVCYSSMYSWSHLHCKLSLYWCSSWLASFFCSFTICFKWWCGLAEFFVTRNSYSQIKAVPRRAASVSIRCEQSSKEGSSLDVWLGRSAMVGFAAAISVEIATGKGLLENFGISGPLPTVALAVTALVGVLTAVFIFQSASKN